MPSRRIGTLGEPPISTSLFDLAPRGVCLAANVATRAGELLPHRFTHHPLWVPALAGSYGGHLKVELKTKAGLFSVALVVTQARKPARPDVIRLAALWCSDFPLLPKATAVTRFASLHGADQYSKKR